MSDTSLPPNFSRQRITTLFPNLPSLIGSDSVIGAPVFDEREHRVGTVERVMIEKRSGRIYYAVLSFHRVRALRGSYHQVPWILLAYDEDLGGFKLNIGRMRTEPGAITVHVEAEAAEIGAIRSAEVLHMSDFMTTGLRPQ